MSEEFLYFWKEERVSLISVTLELIYLTRDKHFIAYERDDGNVFFIFSCLLETHQKTHSVRLEIFFYSSPRIIFLIKPRHGKVFLESEKIQFYFFVTSHKISATVEWFFYFQSLNFSKNNRNLSINSHYHAKPAAAAATLVFKIYDIIPSKTISKNWKFSSIKHLRDHSLTPTIMLLLYNGVDADSKSFNGSLRLKLLSWN